MDRQIRKGQRYTTGEKCFEIEGVEVYLSQFEPGTVTVLCNISWYDENGNETQAETVTGEAIAVGMRDGDTKLV